MCTITAYIEGGGSGGYACTITVDDGRAEGYG